VKRELPGGYELDDDPARIDVDSVHDYLANRSYWAEGRPRETVERLVREATRVVGLYAEGRQVGFARAFSDGVALAYLADVYVLPEHQGRGLGVELVREIVEKGPLTEVKWILHTRDAHDLYRRFGFDEPSERVLERRSG
jgi:GNAT superfamily N-acetyltransferase